MITHVSVITALCRSVVGCTALRVKGPTEGYRCKATYSLYPSLEVSSLVMPRVNEVARLVDEFRCTVSCFAKAFPNFFGEVTVKVSRENEVIIKLLFINRYVAEEEWNKLSEQGISGKKEMKEATTTTTTPTPMTLFEVWKDSEEVELLSSFLLQRVEKMVGIVGHVRMPDESSTAISLKPDKHCSYITLYNTNSLIELTPNGVPYILFCDSFCEVNQPMEDEIYHTIVEFLRLNSSSKENRRVLISGRDVNSVVKTFEEYYGQVTAVTTCPNVHSDTVKNNIPCIFTQKDVLYNVLREHITRPSEDGPQEMHILITAGRHGLHPNTCKEMVTLSLEGKVTDVIYVSCNVESYARDMFIMKEGYRTCHTRSFDFFPGTNYVMTVVHFRSLLLETRRGGLLTLPIGVPGVGKSSLGRYLSDFFHRSVQTTTDDEEGDHHQSDRGLKRKSRKGAKSEGDPRKPFIPRTFAAISTNVTVIHVERDAIFKACKDKGLSLRQSRQETEEKFLSPLHWFDADDTTTTTKKDNLPPEGFFRPLVYLDSTNGSAEARVFYQTQWGGGTPKEWLEAPMLELYFTYSHRSVLMERLQKREGHPSFPNDQEAQDKKLETIENVFSESAVTATPHSSLVEIDSEGTVLPSYQLAPLVVCAHLYFTDRMANLILSDAKSILLTLSS